MTKDEVESLFLNVLRFADSECSSCVENLVNDFNETFPEWEIKVDFDNWYEVDRKTIFSVNQR